MFNNMNNADITGELMDSLTANELEKFLALPSDEFRKMTIEEIHNDIYRTVQVAVLSDIEYFIAENNIEL